MELGLQLWASATPGYGFFADEFYFLECADRLAWGYVDHPPLSVAVLAAVRSLFGEGLQVLRSVPALLGATTLLLTGALARELGGGRAAQLLAGLSVLVSPLYLVMHSYWSMNAFDPALWVIGYLLLARLASGGDARLWLALGVVIGVGLLNKYSMLWFGLGLLVGLCATPERRWLRTRWPWLAALVAGALFAPHVAWQVQQGWPTLEFLRAMSENALVARSAREFLGEQLVGMSPVAAPLWIAGLAHLFVAREARRFRLLGWVWLTVCGLLLASGSAQPYYLAPAYPALLAAGGVALERVTRARRSRGLRWLPASVGALVALGAVPILPIVLSLLPPDRHVAYESAVGIRRTRTIYDGVLPGWLSLRCGWRELARAVATAYAALPAEDRARAGILALSFGEAGAINLHGRELGLPRAVSPHNDYWRWGPGPYTGEVLLVVADAEAPRVAHQDRPADFSRGDVGVALGDLCESVEPAARVECEYCAPYLARKHVWVCRGLRRPLAELWPALRDYI